MPFPVARDVANSTDVPQVVVGGAWSDSQVLAAVRVQHKPSPPSAASGGGGGVPAGSHTYKLTFQIEGEECPLPSDASTPVVNGSQAAIIVTGDENPTGGLRYLYRSDGTRFGRVGAFPATGTMTDNASSLGASPPISPHVSARVRFMGGSDPDNACKILAFVSEERILSPVRITTLSLRPETAEARAELNSHPKAQRVRWWRAWPSPTYDVASGRPSYTERSSVGNEWTRVEEDVCPYRALVHPLSLKEIRYSPDGLLQVGDVKIVTMSDEIPIGKQDWIIPLGIAPTVLGPPTQTTRQTDVLTRAGKTVSLTGTISSSGTGVTGIGTSFLSDLVPGDVLSAFGQQAVVSSIADDTHLTLSSAPTPTWTNGPFEKGSDDLLYEPADSIVDVRDTPDGSHVYDPSLYTLIEGKTVVWLDTDAPSPGARYTVTYLRTPRYVAVLDLGNKGNVYKGIGMPQQQVMRLWSPEMDRTR